MARGFVCLTAVLDWFSRRALSWRVSITMEVDFCLEAVEEALARHGKPEIFNTGQGSQFTSATPINASPWDQPAGEPLNGGVTLFRRTRPPLSVTMEKARKQNSDGCYLRQSQFSTLIDIQKPGAFQITIA